MRELRLDRRVVAGLIGGIGSNRKGIWIPIERAPNRVQAPDLIESSNRTRRGGQRSWFGPTRDGPPRGRETSMEKRMVSSQSKTWRVGRESNAVQKGMESKGAKPIEDMGGLRGSHPKQGA